MTVKPGSPFIAGGAGDEALFFLKLLAACFIALRCPYPLASDSIPGSVS